MSILSGFLKTKKHRKMADGNYKLQSEWTSASTVEMADGNTAETNLGAIQGITDSFTATSSNIALSAKAGNNLQGQIDTVNSNLDKKQDKLTNPLTQSDVVNNLTSASTTKPLSAAQGKTLKSSIDTVSTDLSTHKKLKEIGYYYNNSSVVTLASGSNQKIYLNKQINAFNSSDFFVLSDGGIKCLKAGVVKVNASIGFTNLTEATYLSTVIYKNSSVMISKSIGSQFDVCIDIYNHPIQVSAGDIIYLYGYCSVPTGVKGNVTTRMEIEYAQT